MKNNFWKNKNVLITGHTGFKGSWLAIWMELMGANVIGLSIDENYDNGNFKLSGIGNRIVDVRGDIGELDVVRKVFNENKIDIVFHLAAQPLVSEGYKFPLETYKTNVIGTQNILEAIRECDEKMVCVFITTDKVYENKESIWGYREIDALGGYDPYSSSKACCEILINSYKSSYFNIDNYDSHKKSIASVRAGNVVGGGDWSLNRIIPDLVRSYESQSELVIRRPESVRPWQHVLEALGGYINLAEKMYDSPKEYCEAWNFGPDTGKLYSVKDIVEKVNSIVNNKIKIKYFNNSNFHETTTLCLDITKSKLKLDWQPMLSFDKTIEITMEWYLNYKTENVLDLCRRQIGYFTN